MSNLDEIVGSLMSSLNRPMEQADKITKMNFVMWVCDMSLKHNRTPMEIVKMFETVVKELKK